MHTLDVFMEVYQQVYQCWVQDYGLFFPALHHQVSVRVCEDLASTSWWKVQVEARGRLPLLEAQETTRKEMAIEDKRKT